MCGHPGPKSKGPGNGPSGPHGAWWLAWLVVRWSADCVGRDDLKALRWGLRSGRSSMVAPTPRMRQPAQSGEQITGGRTPLASQRSGRADRPRARYLHAGPSYSSSVSTQSPSTRERTSWPLSTSFSAARPMRAARLLGSDRDVIVVSIVVSCPCSRHYSETHRPFEQYP